MAGRAFFERDGAAFVPADIARGPWDPKSLHGRVVAGLLAHEIEVRSGDPALQVARLTVDLWRFPPFAPARVDSKVVRDGNRIRVVDAEFVSDGVSIGRASALMLRRSENPAGQVWSPPDWRVPAPDGLPPAYEGPEEAAWETRVIDNGFGSTEQQRAWLRELRPLVEGVELTAFVRAALAADFTNPLANSGGGGLEFVNADITLYLHRLPEGEWLGFEVSAHHSADGVAVGECTMYDLRGAIGRSLVCAPANRRMRG
jgi:acyl-CoA thioesterase